MFNCIKNLFLAWLFLVLISNLVGIVFDYWTPYNELVGVGRVILNTILN